MREDVATRTGLRRKLDEEGGKEVATVLFIKVPEVEIKVSHQGRLRLAEACNVLDDRRTGGNVSFLMPV